MKKLICVLMLLMMALNMVACGGSEEPEANAAPEYVPGVTTIARLEMPTMPEKEEENAGPVTPVTYTTNGITYTLDSSFKPGDETADSAQHKYYSDTMWITAQIVGNTFGYTSSQEIAEDIAAQKDTREVGSRNGVYYVEEASSATVKAYYVDNSGSYWIIYGFITGGTDYNEHRDALIDFCTSGMIG